MSKSSKNDSSVKAAEGIAQSKEDAIDDMEQRVLPFYEVLLNNLEPYDFDRKGSWKRYYNGLLGIPDLFNDTSKYKCWGPKIISRRLISWDLDKGIDTDSSGNLFLDMDRWGAVNADIKGEGLKVSALSIVDMFKKKALPIKTEIQWKKLIYCLTAKLFFFPLPQLTFITLRFLAIFMNIFRKAFQIIFACIGNILMKIAESIQGTGILYPFGKIIELLIYGIWIPFGFLGVEQVNTGNELNPKTRYAFRYYKVNSSFTKELSEQVIPEPLDILKAYLGVALPIAKFNSKFGEKYGTGGLFWIILTIMCISAILIFVGGSSIIVAYVGFFMYIFKVIKMLGDFKEDKAESSTPKEK